MTKPHKPARQRPPAPAPVVAATSRAFPGALLLAGGDARRVRVVSETTAYTINSPGLEGPPWPPRRSWQR